MKLFKNVKVKISGTLKLSFGTIHTYDATIKKYGGKCEIVDYKYDNIYKYSYNENNKYGIAQEIKRLLGLVMKCDDFEYELENIKSNMILDNTKEINRTYAEVTYKYITIAEIKLSFITYGKLYINHDSFEDSFITHTGYRYNELIDLKKLQELFGDYLSYDGKRLLNYEKVNIDMNYDDDVQLLPDNDEILDIIYSSKDQIVSELAYDFRDYCLPNPDDE